MNDEYFKKLTDNFPILQKGDRAFFICPFSCEYSIPNNTTCISFELITHSPLRDIPLEDLVNITNKYKEVLILHFTNINSYIEDWNIDNNKIIIDVEYYNKD